MISSDLAQRDGAWFVARLLASAGTCCTRVNSFAPEMLVRSHHVPGAFPPLLLRGAFVTFLPASLGLLLPASLGLLLPPVLGRAL